MTDPKHTYAEPEFMQDALNAPTIDFGSMSLAPAPEAPADSKILGTPAVKLILNRISYAVKRGSPLCVVTGEHGGGKSTSARLYAGRNPRAIYLEVPPEYNAREVVADLCQRLGINAGEAWRVRTGVLVRYLQEHTYTVLLDEAQRLDYRALDMLKYIADSAGITIVLLGSPSLDRVVDRHTDIASRAWVRAQITAIDLETFTKLYAAQGYSPKTLKAVHDVTKGVMRSITALFEHMDEGLRRRPDMSRADLTPTQVRAVADEVLS